MTLPAQAVRKRSRLPKNVHTNGLKPVLWRGSSPLIKVSEIQGKRPESVSDERLSKMQSILFTTIEGLLYQIGAGSSRGDTDLAREGWNKFGFFSHIF